MRRSMAVALLAVLPIAALLVWQAVSETRAMQARVQESLDTSAQALAGAVQRELDTSLAALRVLAQSEIFQQGRIAALARLLHGRPRRDWDSIFLLDRDGTPVLDTGNLRGAAASAPFAAVHERVLQGKGPVVVSAPINDALRPAVVIAQPVMQAGGGGVRYVLAARVNADAWPRLVVSSSVPPGAHAVLLDEGGHLIGESGAASVAPRRVYAASAPVGAIGWQVRMSTDAAPIDSVRRRALLDALAPGMLALLAGLALAALAARVWDGTGSS